MGNKAKKSEKAILFERTNRLLIYLVRLSLLFAAIFELWKQEWMIFLIGTITLLLTYLPNFVEKKFKVDLPIEFEILTVLFIYAAIFLGESKSFFLRYWWWDILIHFTSAIIFALMGFIFIYFMGKTAKIKINPAATAIFTFSFALAIGAMWEILEFLIDVSFGMNMQKSGLWDTMGDLIVDAVAAFLMSAFAYFHSNKNKGLLGLIIKRIEEYNPRIFKK